MFVQMKVHKCSRADNSEIAKVYWRHLRILYYQTTWLISTTLSTNLSWINACRYPNTKNTVEVKQFGLFCEIIRDV